MSVSNFTRCNLCPALDLIIPSVAKISARIPIVDEVKVPIYRV